MSTNLQFIIQDQNLFTDFDTGANGITSSGFILPSSENLSTFKDVVFTETVTIALRQDGTLVYWGIPRDIDPGPAGEPDTDIQGSVINFPAGITFEKLSASPTHVLGLRYDGTVVAWGDNYYGQCNVPPGLNSVVQIDAGGGEYSLALKSDNTVVCWGGAMCDELRPSVEYVKLSAHPSYYAGIRPNGRLDIIPDGYLAEPNTSRKFKDVSVNGRLYLTIEATGSSKPENTINVFSDDPDLVDNIPSTGVTGDFIGSWDALLFVGKTNGSLTIYGNQEDYNYPTNLYGLINIPVVNSIKKLVIGQPDTLATAIILDDNDVAHGWGSNNYNQVSIPTQGLTFIKQIEMGRNHAILLDTENKVRCIGYNNSGECEVPNDLSGVSSVWAGGVFSGVIKQDGTVFGWGGTERYLNTDQNLLDVTNQDGQPGLMESLNNSGITGALKVSIGKGEAYILTDRGTVHGVTGTLFNYFPPSGTSYIGNFFSGNFYTTYGHTSGISLNNITYMSDQNQNTTYHFAVSNVGVVYGWGREDNIRKEITSIPQGITFKRVEKSQGLVFGIKEDNTLSLWGSVAGYSLGTLPPSLES